MFLPTVQGSDPEKKLIYTFGGLNQGFTIGDNEFSDMENMSGDDRPYLATRQARKKLDNFTEDGAGLDRIITDSERRGTYDTGTGVKIHPRDGYDLSGEQVLFDYYEQGEKKEVRNFVDAISNDNGYNKYPIISEMRGFVRFGNNVIAYPHPEIINSGEAINRDDTQNSLWLHKKLYGYNETPASEYAIIYNGTAFFKISPYYGTKTNKADNGYKIVFRNGRSNDRLMNSIYYFYTDLTVGTRLRLQKYENGILSTDDFDAAFFVVTDFSYEDRSSAGDQDYIVYIYAVGYTHDGAPLVGLPEYSIKAEELYRAPLKGVMMTKVNIDATLLAVHQNRLWGTDTLGSSLYCSSATDFRNWEIDGTDAGGGYVDVPENAPWTAIHEYGGYLYAFKANKMYKIVGDTALTYAAVLVCEIGCVNHEAVCVCDSVLYFLSRDGVYGFTGNLPVKVSDALTETYVWGNFGARGQKLYASLTKADGTTDFMAYDTANRMWHKEDDFAVRSFVNYTDGLYALGEDRNCYKLESGTLDSDVPFSVTTKKFFYTFDEKAISSATLWLDVNEDTTVTIEIAYDGGPFEVCGSYTNIRLKYIPIRLKYCNEFQIRISGAGFCRLKQIEFDLVESGRLLR